MNPGPRSPPARSLRPGVGDKSSTQIIRYQEGGDRSLMKELQGARKESREDGTDQSLPPKQKSGRLPGRGCAYGSVFKA